MPEEHETPRIYVASLSDYNAGRLVGAWIDATQSADDIAADIGKMIREKGCRCAEEWAIHDYDGFLGIRLSEWESLERVSLVANMIAEHGEPFAAWLDMEDEDNVLGDPDGVEDLFSAAYAGEMSLEDYALQDADDLGWLAAMEKAGVNAGYFDAAAYANDLRQSGDMYTSRGYAFRSVAYM